MNGEEIAIGERSRCGVLRDETMRLRWRACSNDYAGGLGERRVRGLLVLTNIMWVQNKREAERAAAGEQGATSAAFEGETSWEARRGEARRDKCGGMRGGASGGVRQGPAEGRGWYLYV